VHENHFDNVEDVLQLLTIFFNIFLALLFAGIAVLCLVITFCETQISSNYRLCCQYPLEYFNSGHECFK